MLISKVLDVDLSIPNSVKEKFIKKKWFMFCSTFIILYWSFIYFWSFFLVYTVLLKLLNCISFAALKNSIN